MRTYLFILTLLFIQTINGQSNISELKSYLDTIENTEQVLNLKAVKFDSLDMIEIFHDLNRKLDFGFEHQRISTMTWTGDLILNIISRKGRIKIIWISAFDSNNEKTKIIKDSGFLSTYISKHNELYKTEQTESDLKEQILAEYVVGFGCGLSGNQISKESKKSIQWTKRKSERKLNNYLTSISPELQTLGAIGLLKIGKLDSEQKRLIEHLKNRNSVIFSCSGCLYGIGETFNERIDYYE